MKGINFRIFAVFFIACLLLIFIDLAGLFNPIKSVVQIGLSPIERITYVVKNGIYDQFSFLSFWRSGEERIKDLERRNLELMVSAKKANALQAENAELKKQLGVASLTKSKRLPAEVLGVGLFMSLNQGENSGVRVGQSVIYLDNFVGMVVKVNANSCFVELPTNVQMQVPVKIGAAGEVRGVVFGQFDSTIILDQVAQNEKINVGDTVLTSGDEGKFAPDMFVGKIKRIISAPTDLFQRAEVEPSVKYDQLDTVFVVL